MRVHFEYAVSDHLGSTTGTPNVGIYLNNSPVPGSFANGLGGTGCFSWDGVIGCDQLLNPTNVLHFYIENVLVPAAAIMYSATLRVYSCAQPEQVSFCSGPDVLMRTGPATLPLQSTLFSVANGDFNCTTAAVLVTNPPGAWCPTLPPCASWLGSGANGSPAQSALFCQQFTINNCTGSIGRADLVLQYAVDDHLGDFVGGGPNIEGIYINGSPIPNTHTTAGGPGICRTMKRNVGPWLRQGVNTFALYCRDTAGSRSGAMWAATITIKPCDKKHLGLGCAFTDLDISASPFQLGGTGTFEFGPLPPMLPIGILVLSLTELNPPLDLTVLGAPSCFLHIAPSVMITAFANAAGNASYSLAIPNDPALLGSEVFGQGAVFDPTANPLGLVLTPAVRAEIED
ncbi:MAG: hypothetical protein ABIP94_15065 [Planctomycetota bacterium]